MWRVATCVALLGAVAEPVTAADSIFFQTGNTLLSACEDPAPVKQTFCVGYIEAIADIENSGEGVAGSRSCIPPMVTGGQLRDIVIKGLRRMPEIRHNGVSSVVAAVLVDTFPCAP